MTLTGGLGVMRQFIGTVRDESTVRDLLLGRARRIRAAAEEVDRTELLMMERDDEADQMAYAQALVDWGDAGGYDQETWDMCTVLRSVCRSSKAQWRQVTTLSGGEQKRLVLEALLRGPEEVLLLDEPDNYLDVPAKRWLEEDLSRPQDRAVHQPRPRADRASGQPHRDPRARRAGATLWVHPGRFSTYPQARATATPTRGAAPRWDEERVKLKTLVQTLKVKAKYNDGMASRYQAAQTRLAKFEQAGPPEETPLLAERDDATGRRAYRQARDRRTALELTGLMKPFDLEIWYGERVADPRPQRSGKSHFLRLLARGGTDPEPEHRPVGDVQPAAVAHTGVVRLGSRVRPGWFAQTHEHPSLMGRTLLEILHRGDEHREGMPREGRASARPLRAGPVGEQRFDSLSGGQQARFQILLLELSGATMLLLDEPTDNLDLQSAEALEEGLERFEGTVVAVTHDRGSPAGSTGSWCSAPTARSTKPPSRVGRGRVVRPR